MIKIKKRIIDHHHVRVHDLMMKYMIIYSIVLLVIFHMHGILVKPEFN